MKNTIVPPGIQLEKVGFTKLEVNIAFPNARPSTPFPPLVQAYFESKALQVSAVVLIDANASIDAIQVYYEKNDIMPNLYVTYDAPEESSANFSAYQVNFMLDISTQPKTIQTTVWNEDPETSRGTITTVQP
ncbi:hypothetical protein [Flavobacterium sp. J27]|uniref:hypothetical protein n=1 Tax=Flavobacterium sp. J27 TaxID=2060419 RepID=UPI00102FE31D|nr:hypothetical protein [Flavobacterium sp. J27]